MSADPLSPERGSYQFAQQMLRQVAYDTLSRRDRKARHLAVAAHLRAVFPGDGEEVTEVIARHYLDALNAIPDDPDAALICGQAVTALTRAAERAERTGAPAQAAASYATAAELSPPEAAGEATASLWERAARAANADASYPSGHRVRGAGPRPLSPAWSGPGRRARPGSRRPGPEQLGASCGGPRAAHRRRGHPASRSRHRHRVGHEPPSGSRGVRRLARRRPLSAESLALGQALNVGPGQLSELLLTRGLYHLLAERRPQAISYFRESARLAGQAGDNFTVGRALLNLADALHAQRSRRSGRRRADRRRASAPHRAAAAAGRSDHERGRGAASDR